MSVLFRRVEVLPYPFRGYKDILYGGLPGTLEEDRLQEERTCGENPSSLLVLVLG